MHRQTKMTDIPARVKAAVAARDCTQGPATCILCGAPGGPHCHVVRRSQGGMGVVENIVTLCGPCHYVYGPSAASGVPFPGGHQGIHHQLSQRLLS